jgi:tripartite-type tricarboxylate transporter receptor subunit TctC
MKFFSTLEAIGALAVVAIFAALPTAQAQAQAQKSSLADKPIRLFIGFSAGGTSDILARLVASKIGPTLGTDVIVMNRPGANGNIAAADMVRSTPDGLTLYVGSFNNPVNEAANRKLPFDFIRDFAPVATLAYMPNVLIVNKNLPAHNVKDLIALGKREPGKLTFGSSGAGSSQHMAGELFMNMAGIDMVHVPYTGSAPAITDLVGGHIDMLFDNLPTALPQIKGGTVHALAVTGSARAASLPDVPTVAESGLPGFNVTSFFALYAPTGTPQSVIHELNRATNKALAAPDLQQKFALQGADVAPGTPQQLRTFTENEVAKWRPIIKAAHIVLE